MKEKGMRGKRSLLSNFILRNEINQTIDSKSFNYVLS